MRIIIIIFLICSCGKRDEAKCTSGEQKRLLCQANVVERYFPAPANEFEMQQCKALYQLNGCY